jgi:hypothetical protein
VAGTAKTAKRTKAIFNEVFDMGSSTLERPVEPSVGTRSADTTKLNFRFRRLEAGVYCVRGVATGLRPAPART